MPRNFTWDDVVPWATGDGNIFATREELEDLGDGKYPESGYGAKIKTDYKIYFEGKAYRIYATCWSNAASNWFIVDGKRIYIN